MRMTLAVILTLGLWLPADFTGTMWCQQRKTRTRQRDMAAFQNVFALAPGDGNPGESRPGRLPVA